MNIIIGASGHVGSSVLRTLRLKGRKTLAITHSSKHLCDLQRLATEVALVSIHDVQRLASVFSRGDAIFILNPPADPSQDAYEFEMRSVNAILEALRISTAKKVVAASTQGAQKGRTIGDLGTLYELELGLKRWGGPCQVMRGAYYYSNWNILASVAQKTGKLQTFFPADFRLPMVAPEDLGQIYADAMLSDFHGFSIQDVSGPNEYSAKDVAASLSRIYAKRIDIEEIPQSKWIATYKQIGFSDVSAKSFAGMTYVTLKRLYEIQDVPIRGRTDLNEYFKNTLRY